MRCVVFFITTALVVPLIVACSSESSDSTPPTTTITTSPQPPSRVRLPVPEAAPVIRVRLQRVRGDLNGVEFAHHGQQVTLRNAAGEQTDRTGPLTIRRDRHGWLLHPPRQQQLTRAMQDATWLELVSKSGDAITMTDDSDQIRRYQGTLRLVHLTDEASTTWDVVEYVNIEAYLPGVLAGELYGSWGTQCQAAQAIAARSFACMQIHHRRHRHWDVSDTAASQAYIGQVENSVTNQATRMTHGMVLTFEDQLVPGYFSSCCGGRAATGTEAIGPNPINGTPPLMGHSGDGFCQNAPLYSWKRQVRASDLGRLIADHGQKDSDQAKLKTITSVTVAKRNQHGRGIELAVTDIHGRMVSVQADDLLVWSRGLDDGPLYSGWIEGERHGDMLNLVGHGYGHGAGLCQYGAAAMAKAGQSFWKMIEYYYPQAVVVQAWKTPVPPRVAQAP
jgi:stage II sporulation protein D